MHPLHAIGIGVLSDEKHMQVVVSSLFGKDAKGVTAALPMITTSTTICKPCSIIL